MATRKKRKPTKKAAAKGGRIGGKSKGGSSSQPKFGSAAWFAKYPKAKRFGKKKKGKKK